MYQEILKYTVSFFSEAHPGTGLAVPGQADALVARNTEDIPCLPEGAIKGMVRDGAERLMGFLGSSKSDPLIMTIFGESQKQKGGICSFPPAYLAIGHGETELRYGNRVDPLLGCVAEDFFYSRELLPVHTTFSGKVFSTIDLKSDEKTFLKLSFKMVETFGARRTRGDGTCLISFDQEEPTFEQTNDWLTKKQKEIQGVNYGFFVLVDYCRNPFTARNTTIQRKP